MIDGKIKMTVTVIYDVNLKNYPGCRTIKEAAELDASQDEMAMFSLLESDSKIDIKFEEEI